MSTTAARLRAFNRRWTGVLGLLDRHLLDTPYSLTEARVLYELAQPEGMTERLDLRRVLGLDASFLTRVLARLDRAGLVESTRSPADGRQRRLRLTAAGRRAASDLDRRSTSQIDELIAGLTEDQARTLRETTSIAGALVAPGGDRSVTLRGLQPGDRGWVVQRHGAIYADEYGWNEEFERLVAKIVADFDGGDGERAWIAEVDGARAGCVFCCRADAVRPTERAPASRAAMGPGGAVPSDEQPESTAQLRILLVEPWARGLGLGARLVDECIAFTRAAGYGDVTLWTNDVLSAARRIYQAAGFELVDEEPHHSFGHELVGQHWRLVLRP